MLLLSVRQSMHQHPAQAPFLPNNSSKRSQFHARNGSVQKTAALRLTK
jgi:hypothetical protein